MTWNSGGGGIGGGKENAPRIISLSREKESDGRGSIFCGQCRPTTTNAYQKESPPPRRHKSSSSYCQLPPLPPPPPRQYHVNTGCHAPSRCGDETWVIYSCCHSCQDCHKIIDQYISVINQNYQHNFRCFLFRSAHGDPGRSGHARRRRLHHQLDVRGQVQPGAATRRRMVPQRRGEKAKKLRLALFCGESTRLCHDL